MTLNELKRQFTALSSVLGLCLITKRLKLESSGFRYKVVLYLSYLRIKCDDELKGNPFEFQA